MPYRKRIVDQELDQRLSISGAVVLEGPKAVGKTATAMQRARSTVRLDIDATARELASIDPARVLIGETPRLLDEWQVEPMLWNYVRHEIDDRATPGQFILTGSAMPADDETRHTGAGRFSRIPMRPMTLFESGVSNGRVSLANMFEDLPLEAGPESHTSLDELAQWIVRGGWPALSEMPAGEASLVLSDYLDEIRRADISRLDNASRDPLKLQRMMSSLARSASETVSLSRLAAEVGGSNESSAASHHTIRAYLDALTRLMIIEPLPPWSPAATSPRRITQSSKQHFVDPSLAAASLAINDEYLLNDPMVLGHLFESLVVRDLRVYSQLHGGKVFHYRRYDGLEVDAVIENRSGHWAGFEVKLNANKVNDAAKALLKLQDESKRKPVFLAAVVPTGYAYTRPDGVHVIPIDQLGP